ncbi:hypothetical protein MFAL_03580 [Mycolicibacterium fallax]|nr:hypothetical protein MFAL_03580 [Mycolicibacterium fallax]
MSAKCGLPASSIYWHFRDKDALIAAVIARSFERWSGAWTIPTDGTPELRIEAMVAQIAQALLDSPDFLRLGLMLALEHRPVEASARAMFLRVRAEARATLAAGFGDMIDGLTPVQLDQLVTYAIAGADGLFIANEIGGDAVDLVELLGIHAHALLDLAQRMSGARL